MISRIRRQNADRAEAGVPESEQKRPRGRPSKLNPERVSVLLDALRAGNWVETACRAAGIGKTTLNRWLDRGRSKAPEEASYRAFRAAYKKARAEAEISALQVIRDAATKGIEGQWQAAAWYLERAFPERWGRVDRLKMLNRMPEGPTTIQIRYVDDWRADPE